MPEQYALFVIWWGIIVGGALCVCVIGTVVYDVLGRWWVAKQERRRKANLFRPTHRRTYPKC
ncbi:hypothetical protein LCGC14_1530840 [marine sediment metagenome]|uniref:Uncharacterized protein n=1 Tax=marine sediment metagenome TaxID=412755 RepID=A0A0F9IVV1_9ZZZZ